MLDELKNRISSFKTSKGGKGSVCVIGGSFEYTGAPFFAAISALRAGADLSFVICDKAAANVIKTYSPELIVFGLLDHTIQNRTIEFPAQITNRITALLIGPGLSRNSNILDQVIDLLNSLALVDIPIIIDGDGIFLFKNKYELFKARFKKIILTPNHNEFIFLNNIYLENTDYIIYSKGETDVIFFKNSTYEIRDKGAPRRCGGIGDILGGVISSLISMHGDTSHMSFKELIDCSSIAGKIVRKATSLAFANKRRSMSALDVIENIGVSFEQIFE